VVRSKSSARTLSKMTCCIMTLSTMTLSIMALSIMTLSIMALGIMHLKSTLNITDRIMTLSIKHGVSF
jgi:hypothetical protein